MFKSNKIKTIKKTPKYIYLDYASSVLPNPSSIHAEGLKMKQRLEKSREKVASILSTRPNQIFFTSGGTESNNIAIQGLVYYFFENNFLPHIITTNIEHPSVLATFKLLEKRKLAQVSIVPVEPSGIVDVNKIKKLFKKNTVLVSVMYANNEIGTVQPIKEIAKEIRYYRKKNPNALGLPFLHTDAVQATLLDLNVERLGVDMLSLSGSKIEGEAGRVGMLYKKTHVPLAPLYGGGDQEEGIVPGTEKVKEIENFTRALFLIHNNKEKENKHLLSLRNYFLDKLRHSHILKNIGMLVNGDLENRLSNNLNITIPKIPSDLLIIELSQRGIYASSKSACKSGDGKASYVIQAINPEIKETDGSLRFSFGAKTTKSDLDYTVKMLEQILLKLGKWYN